MKVGQARDIARQWVVAEASGTPGFCGAYTAGSANWLPDEAELARTSDFDVLVVLTDPHQVLRRGKFRYRDVLLEASYLSDAQLRSAELVLSNYHLAPSFATSTILLDPSGHLTALRAIVCREYSKQHWVRERCAHARENVLRHLRSTDDDSPFCDQVMACLFGAGVTTHVLLAAALKNPTVRARYVAVRKLLADHDDIEFQETLLALLGAARISRERAKQHLSTLAEIFDAATRAVKKPFPFASDLSEVARPIAINGSLELIERGYHREAMFWIAVTHSRCQKVLSADASRPLPQNFSDSYRDLAGDFGMASSGDVRRRCVEVERSLPRVWQMAERLMAAS